MADLRIEWPAGRGGQRVLHTVTSGLSAPLSALLMPVERAYAGAMALRNLAFNAGVLRAHRVGVPVISVGNIIAGGAGKTPFTRWLVTQLLARGRQPAVLHGGYGSDEPRLHRQWHPEVTVVVDRDRVDGARHAIDAGADVIVLDDAFQHRRLARDLDIVLMAAETTNARMLPRGPGREPLRALRRSGYVLITRKCARTEDALLRETQVHQVAPGVPTGRAHLRITTAHPPEPVLAVAAIARPDLFLAQLREQQIDVAGMLAYPDHFDYGVDDAAHIAARAGNRLVVTTAKDAVKLRELLPEQALHVVEQELVFEGGAGELMTALDNVL